MSKRAPTKAEKAYMGKISSLGCLVCGGPAQLHHIREGQGMSQRASNWLVVPLCVEHHLGDFSIHKDKHQFERIIGSELDLLAMTIERLNS